MKISTTLPLLLLCSFLATAPARAVILATGGEARFLRVRPGLRRFRLRLWLLRAALSWSGRVREPAERRRTCWRAPLGRMGLLSDLTSW